MSYVIFLWFLVWGGMFTRTEYLSSISLSSNPLIVFQGIRSLFPILAVYLIFLWIFALRPPFPFIRNPIRFLIFYCSIGITVSLFLSPAILTALYWSMMYLSPLLVLWKVLDRSDALQSLRKLIYLNYGIFIVITFLFFQEMLGGPKPGPARMVLWKLPFNLGEMRANGVGRFALVTIIIAGVRLMTSGKKAKILWLIPLVPSFYLLARTQSRTALLGLAISGVLIILIKQLDWRLIFASPVAAYIIWISGINWRAHGSIDKLIDLSGREMTWQRAIELIKQSPFIGWGFHADRLLLNSEHMHNSFLHAMIHAGIIGTVCFILAFITVWHLIVKSNIFGRARFIQGPDQAMLIESVLFLGFMTSRSFFESTGAFYGVDLLLIVPAMAFIHLWAVNNPQTRA